MTKFDLEEDLMSSVFIKKKVQESELYAQSLYAALCNRYWCKEDTWCTLNGKYWHCSWRHSGKIVAALRDQGDYMDWYASGIPDFKDSSYVGEGFVTDEILQDLASLGWFLAQ